MWNGAKYIHITLRYLRNIHVTSVFIYRKMVFTEEDKVAIEFLWETKCYGAKRLLAEFPSKQWLLGGLNKLLKKIDETGSVKRSKGAGRPQSVRHNDNIERVEQLALSQEDKPGTHLTQWEIAHETGISQPTVSRILRNDLHIISASLYERSALGTEHSSQPSVGPQVWIVATLSLIHISEPTRPY